MAAGAGGNAARMSDSFSSTKVVDIFGSGRDSANRAGWTDVGSVLAFGWKKFT